MKKKILVLVFISYLITCYVVEENSFFDINHKLSYNEKEQLKSELANDYNGIILSIHPTDYSGGYISSLKDNYTIIDSMITNVSVINNSGYLAGMVQSQLSSKIYFKLKLPSTSVEKYQSLKYLRTILVADISNIQKYRYSKITTDIDNNEIPLQNSEDILIEGELIDIAYVEQREFSNPAKI